MQVYLSNLLLLVFSSFFPFALHYYGRRLRVCPFSWPLQHYFAAYWRSWYAFSRPHRLKYCLLSLVSKRSCSKEVYSAWERPIYAKRHWSWDFDNTIHWPDNQRSRCRHISRGEAGVLLWARRRRKSYWWQVRRRYNIHRPILTKSLTPKAWTRIRPGG